MKQLFVQNIDASDVSTEQITMPTSTQESVASLLNTEGKSLIEAWFFGKPEMFNSNLSKIRNGAVPVTVGQYDREQAGATPVQSFETTPNGVALKTSRARYPFQRSGNTGWTIATVVRANNIQSGQNRSVFGWQPGDTTSINLPSLNISVNGLIRCFYDSGQDVATLFASMAAPNINDKPYCIVVSQKEGVGVTLRVNGNLVLRQSSANGIQPSQGLVCSFMGSDVISAAWEGWMYEAILMNDDISDNQYAVSTVENHLMTTYSIIPD